MTLQYIDLIKDMYAAFNARQADEVLSHMHADVHWPNGWEGGYVEGHDEVKAYWTRQWAEINPIVEPIGFTEKDDNVLEVEVHQVVKDYSDNLLFDGVLKHVYTFKNGLITEMAIEK